MLISPFFLDMRAAYQAELDDLRLDSEGKDVLRRRLADKRREIGFLVQMITLSPEMVAVVFHQAFRFTTPAALDDLLGREADHFPDWEQLATHLELAPWAQPLVSEVLKQPMGDWFMAVAAGLEYMAGKPALAGMGRDDSDNDSDSDSDDPNGDNLEDEFDDEEHEGDGGAQGDAKSRKEAADDWLAEQGFDRKE